MHFFHSNIFYYTLGSQNSPEHLNPNQIVFITCWLIMKKLQSILYRPFFLGVTILYRPLLLDIRHLFEWLSSIFSAGVTSLSITPSIYSMSSRVTHTFRRSNVVGSWVHNASKQSKCPKQFAGFVDKKCWTKHFWAEVMYSPYMANMAESMSSPNKPYCLIDSEDT